MQWYSSVRLVGISLLMATAACGDDPGGLDPGPPAAMEVLSEDTVTAELGVELAEAFTVRATDGEGRPVPGVVVRFEITGDEGVLVPENAMTDDDGRAETSLLPYGFVGTRELTASIDDGPSRTVVVHVTTRTEDLGGFPQRGVAIADATEDGTAVGWVTGSYDLDLYTTALRWTADDGLELLPLPDGVEESRAMAVNGANLIVGTGDAFASEGQARALFWDDGDAGFLPDGGTGSYARDVNADGDIVGAVGDDAAIWRDGGYTILDDREQCDPWPSGAWAINDRGQVVGEATAADWPCQSGWAPQRAVRWWPGEPMQYLPIPGTDEDVWSRAVAVNEAGEVLVRVYTRFGPRDVSRTYFWSETGGATELVVEGATAVEATALNDSSWIGGSFDPLEIPRRPAVWRGPDAEPVVLQEYDVDGWISASVSVITNDGWAYGGGAFWDGADYVPRAARWRIYLPEP